MLINGVLFKLIFISFPNPEAALIAIAFKKFPFLLDSTVYIVLLSAPLTFLTCNCEISVSVNSKILMTSAIALFEKKRLRKLYYIF